MKRKVQSAAAAASSECSSGSDTESNGDYRHGSSAAACLYTPFVASSSKAIPPRIRRITKPKPNTTDDGELLLAKELGQLSMSERESVYHDIHGVSTSKIIEDPLFVDRCLSQFDAELTSIRKKPGYDKAVFVSPQYVKDRNFRLMFLRADSFQVTDAVRRIIHHFEEKFKLFGYDRIGKPIQWDDLDEDDQASIAAGAIQFFTKDRVGRGLFFNIYAHRTDKTTTNHLRALWYMFMAGIQNDTEVQKRGVVLVAYTLGTSTKDLFQSAGMTKNQDFEKVLPFRVSAIHVCFGDQRFKPIISTFMAAHPQANRLRVRVHFGSHLECQYSLTTFGIAESMIPFTQDGSLKAELFQKRFQARREEEEAEYLKHQQAIGKDLIPFPLTQDVVLGRGSPYQKFPGNQALQQLVESYKAVHDKAASRASKTAISVQVVKELHINGTRFLKRHESEAGWQIVDDEVAREKVAMGFRNLTRKIRPSTSKTGQTS